MSNAVLVQEWIEGVEYAVDTVSRDGEHKVTAMWKYDKRPVNGGPFVYFCTELEGFRVYDYPRQNIMFVLTILTSSKYFCRQTAPWLERWTLILKLYCEI